MEEPEDGDTATTTTITVAAESAQPGTETQRQLAKEYLDILRGAAAAAFSSLPFNFTFVLRILPLLPLAPCNFHNTKDP